jgi:1,4-dihydroxy-2-naphthoate octaprenyltransferase
MSLDSMSDRIHRRVARWCPQSCGLISAHALVTLTTVSATVCFLSVIHKPLCTLTSRSGEAWDKTEAVRALFLGVVVQAAANVNNTYWDFVQGVDTATVGGGADPSVVMPHKAVLVDGRCSGASLLLFSLCLYQAQ